MSRRVLLTCLGSYGDVFPYIGVAKALQARGHRPVIATSSYYRAAVEQEGLPFAKAGPDVDLADQAALARVMHPRKGGRVVVREYVVPVLRETYRELDAAAAGADVLVSHPLTFAAPVLAEKRGLPWASTILAPLSLFSDTDFPVLPALPGMTGVMRGWPWLRRSVMRLVRREVARWVEPVRALRQDEGLGPGRHPMFEGQFSPHLNLALFSRVLAPPQPDWPAGMHATGFVFYNGPASLDPALDEFLTAGPPPVVFTLGSSAVAAAGRFYHESAEAAGRLGVRAVLLTGGFTDNAPARLPANVLIVDKAPHQLLFPRASAVVHQGGAGTTAQALRSGMPMLVVPHGHDQPDNAFRLTNLGVARTVYPSHYRAGRVERELRALLDTPSYRERAASVADIVRREGGADAAAAAIAAVGT